MKCENCGIEFEGRKDAKYCSSRCRKEAFQKRSIGTDNVTLSEPAGTDNFKFTIRQNAVDPTKYMESKDTVREAKYWYDVPLAAVPIYKKDWPKMPDYMNGRQYFLWWKNEFKMSEKFPDMPEIHNPYPDRGELTYVKAAEGSRHWGTN